MRTGIIPITQTTMDSLTATRHCVACLATWHTMPPIEFLDAFIGVYITSFVQILQGQIIRSLLLVRTYRTKMPGKSPRRRRESIHLLG